jgi:hypothetical protein
MLMWLADIEAQPECSIWRDTTGRSDRQPTTSGTRLASPPASWSFCARMLRGDMLPGTVPRNPALRRAEILDAFGYDFLIAEKEHRPFDHQAKAALFAARATGRRVEEVHASGADPPDRRCRRGAHGADLRHRADGLGAAGGRLWAGRAHPAKQASAVGRHPKARRHQCGGAARTGERAGKLSEDAGEIRCQS